MRQKELALIEFQGQEEDIDVLMQNQDSYSGYTPYFVNRRQQATNWIYKCMNT